MWDKLGYKRVFVKRNVISHKPALHICINQVIEVNVFFSLNDCIFFLFHMQNYFCFNAFIFWRKQTYRHTFFTWTWCYSSCHHWVVLLSRHWFKYCFPWKCKVGVSCLLWKILVTQQFTVHKRKSLHRYVQNRTFKSFNRRLILLIEFL